MIGILIPFIGTTLGSSFVFFLKNKISSTINSLMIGISIGVMLASSIFSLLIPSIQISASSVVVSIGFILGFLFLIFINKITSNKKFDMLMFSVTLHNVPEGMAVGVCFAGFLSNMNIISFTSALMVSIGIAIQNIPEGSIISFPLRLKGNGKFKSFFLGSMSGIVEPLAGFITLLLSEQVTYFLPYLLSFASGAMIYVIFNDLVLEINEDKKTIGTIGIMIGFVIMMVLDITFG